MRLLNAAVVLCCFATVAGAQTPQFDATVRTAVIDTLTTHIERTYLDADTGRMIAAHVRERARAGAYNVDDPRRFASLLTADLRAINGDLHLGVNYSPRAGGGAPGPSPLQERAQHYSVGRMDVLPGNVGYMELNGFSGDTAAREVIVGALQYLKTTDAIIFDLRRNRGGESELSNFLISHFTGADTLPSLLLRSRASSGTFTRYTLATVPGPRRPQVPVYVLTSRGTFSAGEDFAFVMKNLKRATIVGDRTAGAGHNVEFIPLGYGFQGGISFTRVSDPRTGQEWERVGVQPDVKVDPADAVNMAHKLALDTLIAVATQPRKDMLGLVRETVVARLRNHVVPLETLQKYAGDYVGGLKVTLAGNQLMYQPSPANPPEPAVPLSDDSFALASLVHIKFEPDAAGQIHIRATFPDGGTMIIERVKTT